MRWDGLVGRGITGLQFVRMCGAGGARAMPRKGPVRRGKIRGQANGEGAASGDAAYNPDKESGQAALRQQRDGLNGPMGGRCE
jgi:hypothetical protein